MTSDGRFLATTLNKDGVFEVIEITGEPDPSYSREQFLAKKRRFRQKVLDRIPTLHWNLESTESKLQSISEKLSQSGRAAVELSRGEIEDVIANGSKVFDSIWLPATVVDLDH